MAFLQGIGAEQFSLLQGEVPIWEWEAEVVSIPGVDWYDRRIQGIRAPQFQLTSWRARTYLEDVREDLHRYALMAEKGPYTLIKDSYNYHEQEGLYVNVLAVQPVEQRYSNCVYFPGWTPGATEHFVVRCSWTLRLFPDITHARWKNFYNLTA